MSDLLFDIPEVKSPRLLWLEKHGFLTHFAPHSETPWMAILPLPGDKGKTIGQILADNCRAYDESDAIGGGDTEDEAITQLALKLGIKLWNEETKAECDRCFGNRVIDRPALPDFMLPRYGNCPKCNYDGKGGRP